MEFSLGVREMVWSGGWRRDQSVASGTPAGASGISARHAGEQRVLVAAAQSQGGAAAQMDFVVALEERREPRDLGEVATLSPLFKGDHEVHLRSGATLRLSRRFKDALFARMPR